MPGAFVGPGPGPFHPVEPLEDVGELLLGAIPVPVSLTRSTAEPALAAERDLDAPFQGEFEGVGDQVQDDLLPHVAVDEGRLAQGRAVDDQPSSPLFSTADRKTLARSAVSEARSVGS